MKRFIGLSRVSTAGFLTYQTVEKYEEAIARHGQYFRWMTGTLCSCINPNTGQPDPNHDVCKGRGRLFGWPTTLHFRQERCNIDNYGRVFVNHPPVMPNSYQMALRGAAGIPGSPVAPDPSNQPSDNSYIQALDPYPPHYTPIVVDYDYNPTLPIVGENPLVIGVNTLQTVGSQFVYKGKTYFGSIVAVTRVHNVTKNEDYPIEHIEREFIFLQSMGTWATNDILAVDYTYIQPFVFVMINLTPKIRFEATWVLDQADSILIAPYYCDLGPNDVVTMESGDVTAAMVINPTHQVGNDIIQNYFDVYYLDRIVDRNGSIVPPANYMLYGRNQIKWLVTKPTIPYTVVFHYHPSFTILEDKGSVTTAENKGFFSRYNVKIWDRPAAEIVY